MYSTILALGVFVFVFVGGVLGMTVPVLHVKYESYINRNKERLKEQSKRFYDVVDEKLIRS